MVRLKTKRLAVVCIRTLIVVSMVVGYKIWAGEADSDVSAPPSSPSRHLLTKPRFCSDDGESKEFPKDVFTCEQKRKGAIVLHVIGLVYMFVALALVCDEFFIPALSVIIERFNISEDVAGATLMAAGGSAPELATSFVGTFANTSAVGIGTIVGSAVFNILFVIAMCAFFSKNDLELTWWPFARDNFFYVVALALLCYFFSNQRIMWYEALISFLWYVIYVIFMKFNERIEHLLKRCVGQSSRSVSPTENAAVPTKADLENGKPATNGTATNGAAPHMSKSLPSIKSCSQKSVESQKSVDIAAAPKSTKDETTTRRRSRNSIPYSVQGGAGGRRASIPILHSGSGRFRQGMFQLIVHSVDPISEDPEASLKHIMKRIPTIQEMEGQSSGGASTTPESQKQQQEQQNLQKQLDPSQNCSNTLRKSTDTTTTSVATLPPLHPGEDDSDPDKTSLDKEYLKQMQQQNGGAINKAYEPDKPQENGNFNGRKSAQSSSNPSLKSEMAIETRRDDDGETELEEEEEVPLDMSWPKTNRERVIYLVILPITFLLWITVVDVRKPKWKKWFPQTFIMSIVWIGVFSYLMNWWAKMIGEICEIPDQVMGLTFLAAGTSIPDLITSVIVAKKGFGDMAVSSSIGSNIFDVCVGLPVPWLFYAAIYRSDISVSADGMVCSILMLLGMLLAVFFGIVIFKWRMTKGLGIFMLVLYVVFITINILMAFEIINCFA